MTTEYLIPPHLHDGSAVAGLMWRVCAALVPALVCYVWFFGWGILIQCLLAVSFALTCEWLLLKLTGKPLLLLKDGSVIVTALLFAFTVTPFTPWWINLAGILFAVVFAKHLYGGTGYNLFNPAMAGYVFILLSFPAQMNHWPIAGDPPAVSEYFSLILSGNLFGTDGVDAVSGASPLNHLKSQLNAMAMVPEIINHPGYGRVGGTGWEIVNLAALIGGFGLLYTGVIRWHIPAGVLAGLFVGGLFFYIRDSAIHIAPLFHLFSGGAMLGAFFIATDPVTAPVTAAGRIIFGLLIGVLTYAIRTWGGFPDGIAFAVLIGNIFAPLINHYTIPRVLGEERR